jgi:hypothetical protein
MTGLTGVLMAGSIVASSPDALDDCRSIADRDARLECYDRLATPDDSGTQSGTQLGREQPVPDPAVSDAAPATRARPAPPTQRAPPSKETTPAEAPTDQQIVSVSVTATGRVRFRLANGDLWEQIEPRATDLRAGERVTVTKTLFGAWQMREHSGAARSFKVRRLE